MSIYFDQLSLKHSLNMATAALLLQRIRSARMGGIKHVQTLFFPKPWHSIMLSSDIPHGGCTILGKYSPGREPVRALRLNVYWFRVRTSFSFHLSQHNLLNCIPVSFITCQNGNILLAFFKTMKCWLSLIGFSANFLWNCSKDVWVIRQNYRLSFD